MSRPSLYRRKYIINPKFQLKVALGTFISIIIYSLVFGVVLFAPLFQELGSATTIAEQGIISEIILEFHSRFWPALIIVSLLVGIQLIFLTHRVAGPIYRSEKYIRSLIDGNYDEVVTFREKDEFHEVAEGLNSLCEILKKSSDEHAALREDVKEGLSAIVSLIESGTASNSEIAVKVRDLSLRVSRSA